MRRDDERRSASAFASVAPPRLEQQYGCGGCFAQGAAAPLAVDALLLLNVMKAGGPPLGSRRGGGRLSISNSLGRGARGCARAAGHPK